MASGKQARKLRQASGRVPPPPVRGGPAARRASPKVILAAAAVLVVAAVGITLGLTLTGKGSSKPAVTAVATANLAVVNGIQQNGLELGNPLARVTLTEYIDTSCPICQEYVTSIFPSIATQYVRTGKVKIEARVVAFVGPSSSRGRELVLAAARQNKAWQLLELLYENQGTETQSWLTDPLARALAAKVPGLDVAQLFRDAASGAIAAEAATMDGYQNADRISGTPTFVLTTTDGKRHLLGTGLFAPSAFASTFDRALRAA